MNAERFQYCEDRLDQIMRKHKNIFLTVEDNNQIKKDIKDCINIIVTAKQL